MTEIVGEPQVTGWDEGSVDEVVTITTAKTRR
jgi:hypothetical protein